MTMRHFECAGFGEQVDMRIAEACASIASGIRTDIACNDEHVYVAGLAANALLYFEESVFVLAGWMWRENGILVQERQEALDRNPGIEHFANQCESLISAWREYGGKDEKLWIEIGNELDLSYWKNNLGAYHRLADTCYKRVRSLSEEVHFITGSTSNFNKEFSWKRGGHEVLNDLCGFVWPVDTVQGLHPYRGPGRDWPSFDSDEAALRELKKVLRGRQVAITEIGWKSEDYDNQLIADMMRDEIAMWRDFGAVVFCHYQIQDAPLSGDQSDATFGAFTSFVDGLSEKPVATVLSEAKNEVTA